jgi:hypothetical protein
MTIEHYLREIAELLREMNQRLARIENEVINPVLYVDEKGHMTKITGFSRAPSEIPG